MGQNVVELIIDLIKEQIDEIKQEMKAVVLKPWSGTANIKYNLVIFSNAVFKVLGIVQDAVNKLDDPSITQDDVFDAVTKIINDMVDIPWVPEFVEGKAIHFALIRCDAVIDKYLGPDWLDIVGDSIKQANILTSNIEEFIKKVKTQTSDPATKQ